MVLMEHAEPSRFMPAPAIGEGLDVIRAPINKAQHVPGYIYDSPEILELEKEKIFMKDWLCVARVEEIEKPGDFMTFRVMGEPAMVVRDGDGHLNAFANICAHRGVEVASGEGNTKEFMCPYHGWTYDLEGKLTGAAFMKEAQEFTPGTCRLPRLHLATWAGWIFVNFADAPVPFEEFIVHYQQEFALLRQEDCRLAVKLVLDLDCNWKLFVENLIDVYHGATLHAKTIGKNREPAQNTPFRLFERGGTSMFYSSDPMVRGGRSPFGNMPWLEDKPYNFACSGHLAPNMQVIARSDNIHPSIMWPVTPNTCRVINYTLFPQEWFDRPDFEDNIELYREYMVEVLEEDRSMVKSLQGVMSSRNFRPGPLSPLELGIHHVLNDYVDRLFGHG